MSIEPRPQHHFSPVRGGMESGFNADCGCPISMPRDTLNHAAPTGLDGLWCGVIYNHVTPDGAGMHLGRVFYKHAVFVVNPPFFDDFLPMEPMEPMEGFRNRPPSAKIASP